MEKTLKQILQTGAVILALNGISSADINKPIETYKIGRLTITKDLESSDFEKALWAGGYILTTLAICGGVAYYVHRKSQGEK